ncbi:Protein T10B5.4, partial [Aphelenchoides avenae]
MQSTWQSSTKLLVVVWSRSFKKEVQSLARYSTGPMPEEPHRHHDTAYWPVTARHRESESELAGVKRPHTPEYLHEPHHKLDYEVAEPGHSSSILKFIAKHFVPDAALEMALGAPAKEMEDYYEDLVERVIGEKASLLGFRGDHLCAIHLSSIRDFGDASRGEKPPKAMHPKDYVKEISEGKYGHRSANKINAFLRALEEDMPSVFPECRRMLYMEIAS